MAADDLAVLSDVKTWLGITTTNSDTLLGAMITQISAAIRTYVNRDIYPVDSYSATLSGNGRTMLTLPNYPIAAVSSLTINGQSIPALGTYPSCGYAIADNMTIGLNGYEFCKGLNNVLISYTAGYSSIPADINRCCIEWVAFRFREQERIGLRNKVIAQETIGYITAAMPESVKMTLDQWKRVVPV